ncbi:MAG: hypothetical protein JO316_20555 [Abitibacteriaceae bacterium]|nr:hypothetical protein [Abditibacteriaceae bacterium]
MPPGVSLYSWCRSCSILCCWLLLWLTGVALADSSLPWLKDASPPTSTNERPNERPTAGLRLQLSGEEVTGIYFDSQTLKTQTPIVLSLRVTNDAPETRRVFLSWHIADVNGKILLHKNDNFRVEAHGLLLRRELFPTPALGPYYLHAEVTAKRHGPDDKAMADLPFAVVVAPVSGYRPQSFFSLTTPTLLNPQDLDFYQRIGARVLRSPWELPGGAVADGSASTVAAPQPAAQLNQGALDQQTRQRLAHKLATVGVLSLPLTDSNGIDANEAWMREAVPLMTRYEAIRTWEIASPVTAAQETSLALAARASRPNLRLLWPLSTKAGATAGAVASHSQTLDSTTVPWLEEASLRSTQPRDATSGEENPGTNLVAGENAAVHPSGILRTLLTHQDLSRKAGISSCYIHQDHGVPSSNNISAAGSLVTGYLLSIMAGASGMSTTLDSNAVETGAGVSGGTPQQMSRAAAFATVTHLLEDATFEGDLFPQSPTLWGALFHTQTSTIAALWTARDSERGRLIVPVAQADGLDVFGNVVARARHGSLAISISSTPVYLVSSQTPENLNRALHTAKVEGLRPLVAQILPLTQRLRPASSIALVRTTTATGQGTKAKTANTSKSIANNSRPSLRVRLQNILIQPVSGYLRVTPPHGWTLIADTMRYQLQPGEARIYQFAVAQSVATKDAVYPVTATASAGHGRWQWKQALRMATADNVKRGHPLRLDGDLSDWHDATWMQVQGLSSRSRPIKARVALRWNTRRLYIAAEVEEPSFRPRRAEDATYPFWDGYDALQFAFGFHDTPESQPGREPFRDTEYGFLLAPFNQASNGRIEGRLLRLWSPALAFGGATDALRYGGVVPDSVCIIRRDPQTHLTRYEASLPLSEMPSLRPPRRAAQDAPVRFSWVLHNSAGANIQWSRAVAVFPWWNNTGSFLPAQKLYLAAQSLLGFTIEGAIDAPHENSIPKPKPTHHLTTTHPAPQPTPHRPHPRPKPKPRLPHPQRPPGTENSGPPQVAPMSPRLLPPAAPPAGQSLPPSLTPMQDSK